MPFTRPDTLWATIRIRVEAAGPGAVRATVLRTNGFDREALVERVWDVEGPAVIRVRLAQNAQLDANDSLLVVQQVKPQTYPYIESLEAQHESDREMVLLAWPFLTLDGGPDPRPEAPPCTWEADLLVLRVTG